MTCDGIYEVRHAHARAEWLCAECRENLTPKLEHPAQLRMGRV